MARSSASHSPSPPSQKETWAWIAGCTQERGSAPTRKQISAWCGRSLATVDRWLKAWREGEGDPREVRPLDPPAPHPQEPEAPASTPQDAGPPDAVPGHLLSLAGTLSPQQLRAISLRADGKSNKEIAAAVGAHHDSVSRWWRQPEIAAAYRRTLAERHQATEELRKINGQLGARLLQKTLLMLEKEVEWVAQQEELDADQVAKLSRAATSAAQTAMSHGGYPKTEMVRIEGEVGVSHSYEGVPTEDLAESTAALEAELRVLEGGLEDDDEAAAAK